MKNVNKCIPTSNLYLKSFFTIQPDFIFRNLLKIAEGKIIVTLMMKNNFNTIYPTDNKIRFIKKKMLQENNLINKFVDSF